MFDAFVKYPRTPHLEGSCLQRGDETERVALRSLGGSSGEGTFVWEEKIDGANAAFSFETSGRLRLQSRGHVLAGGPREAQFALFKAWAQTYEAELRQLIGTRYIVYGEWCYAKHTVFYDALPHYFLEFDIFDKEKGAFLSTSARRRLLAGSPVVSVPVVHEGRLTTLRDVEARVAPSLYKTANWRERLAASIAEEGHKADYVLAQTDMSDKSEGLYLKQERGEEVIGRYKWVRADFLQTILESDSHWQDRPILPNRLAEGCSLWA